MQSTPNKLTTMKSTTSNRLNAHLNTNSDPNKSLTHPMSSEIHQPNFHHAKPRRQEQPTNSMSMNNKPSPTKNTWTSSSPPEMLKNHTSRRDHKTTKMPSMPSMKPQTSSHQSTVDQDHSLKSQESQRQCSKTPSTLKQPSNMHPSSQHSPN
jgi:hypothetical protein